MKILRHTVLSAAVAAAALGAHAQTDAENAPHYPLKPSYEASKMPGNSMFKESMEAMDSKMQVMREMHQKLMAAKTPEERKALMPDHMKAMQDGMSMMGSSGSMGGMMGMGMGTKKGGMSMNMANRQRMMEKRMEMMGTTMQMMMDRLPAPAAP